MAEYREIPDHPAYRVGDDGSVWTRYTRDRTKGMGKGSRVIGNEWREMAQSFDRKGYRQVTIKLGSQKSVKVHRLVLQVFVGPCPSKMVCRHLDGDPANNHLGNLCWGTAEENWSDKRTHGKATEGERHGMAKLTAKDVLAIRDKYQSGRYYMRELAAEYSVCWHLIHKIIHRQLWKCV